MQLAVVDTETTGLDPGTGEIIEVAIHLVGGGVPVRWSTLVRPSRPIPEPVRRLTGITDEMVADAPRFEDVAGEIWGRLDDRLLVGHNVPFDLRFLRSGFAGIDRPAPASTRFGLCTKWAATRVWRRDSYRLGDLAVWLGLDAAGWHRADADCVMTTGLLRAMAAEQPWPTLLRNGLRSETDQRYRPDQNQPATSTS